MTERAGGAETSEDQKMDTNDAADALYDAIHTSVFREEFRDIYARLMAPGMLDAEAVRAEALRNWPGGAEGHQAELYRREVRSAFERGAAWQSRRANSAPSRTGENP